MLPPGFELPLRRLFVKARRNLWYEQRRREVYPKMDVRWLVRLPADKGVEEFGFALDSESPYEAGQFKPGNGGRPWISFHIDIRLLAMVLLSAAVWNNVEIGALVEIEREPDEYDPTVHALMSFFVL